MRILMAEDDPVSRTVMSRLVKRWGYDVTVCEEGLTAWEKLQDDPSVEIAILDWMMPGMDGVDLCRRIRNDLGDRYVYVILLTARHSVEDVVEAMDAGADDFVGKSGDSRELQVRLRAGRRIMELKEALRRQATHDGLTGLWNTTAIHDLLDREFLLASRQNDLLAVVMCDIDHFKSINDTHGHRAGDEVLRTVCRRLQGELRDYDTLGRYGGEEFLLVLAGSGAAQAANIAERLRQAVCDQPVIFNQTAIPVTISFGVSALPAQLASRSENLVQMADCALYQAKRLGRNRVQVWPQSSQYINLPVAQDAPAQTTPAVSGS